MADPTYTYVGGSGQAKDRLRMLIPDRVSEKTQPPARFSDQELNDILSGDVSGAGLMEAVAVACEIIAMDETKRQLSVSINSGMSISRSNQPSYWLQRAKAIRDRIAADLKIPWEFVDSVAIEYDWAGIDHSHYVGDEE